MRKKRYKKRISATRRFLLSVVAITMLVINLIIPLQVVVAEFIINEQWNDTGEGIIESEDEVSDDNGESTEPELNIEDSTEDTSVDESFNVPDDNSIPKEENTDESIEENVAEEDKQQQESDISKEQENDSSKEEKNDTTITANFSEKRRIIDIFSDINLAKVVAEYFGRDVKNYVTDEELLGITELIGENREIQNLEGIENLRNLRHVKLNFNNIIDSTLSYMRELDNLSHLELNHNEISDIGNLSELVSLEILQLNDNELNTIGELSRLTNLRYLTFNYNEIVDISVASKFTSLETLQLNGNKVRDVSALSNLTSLTELQMNGNQISDLRPLASLSSLSLLNARNQRVQFETGVIGVPTEFKLYDIDGSTPTLKITMGEYKKDEQLIWNITGNNSARWNESNEFDGTVEQTVVPGTTLMFENVPDILEFEEAPIQNSYMTINRKESMSLSIRDTRGAGSTWSIQASIDSPLTSEDGRHRLPDDALVFKGSDGQIKPLSNDSVEVYSGKTTSQSLTTEVSWKEAEGILIHMQPIAAKAGTSYTTTITWTLQNVPSSQVFVVNLFEHKNKGGKVMKITEPLGDPNLRISDFNDRISSIELYPNTRITLYDHIHYGGPSKTYENPTTAVKVINLTGTAWNDRASSFRTEWLN